MQYEGHLVLQELELPASAEQPFTPASGWCIVRLSRGVGYGFEGKKAVEIAPGEILVVPHGQSVVFRASQIGPARLHYFNFQPERLGALLTLPEQRQFAVLAESSTQTVWRLPASHETAASFAAICDDPAAANPLLQRCQILVMAAMIFAPRLPPLPQPALPRFTAQARFLEMLQQLPAADMIKYSPAELADLCRCALPRFKRLFRAHFGVAFRSRQTSLRLERARQLLLETDARINDVAIAAGYPRRRSFNEMFKQHFGLTPSQVRRRAEKSATASPVRPS